MGFLLFSLTELIDVSNPIGYETVNLRSVFDAELYSLIVSAEFDREKPQPHKRLTPGRRFKKNADCGVRRLATE
jgi:hypothetical protein